MATSRETPCTDVLISEAMAWKGAPEKLAAVSVLANDYPRDARLAFLKGSLLAGADQFGEAREAMKAAVRLAPDYHLARFQLGFLELTSGEPAAAEATWRPLEALGADNPLRVFVQGLRHLIADRFPDAIAALEKGIVLNTENPPMNADMRLIIDRLRQIGVAPSSEEAISAAHLLLQRFNDPETRH
jgi:Flp pilus assembly protein TadD